MMIMNINRRKQIKIDYYKGGKQVKLKTEKLQEGLSKVSKGLGKGKFLEVTAYIHIIIEDGKLILTATDTAIYVHVTMKIDTDEQEEFIVEGSKLVDLVNKTTTEFIELNVHERYLEMKGNGVYKLDLYQGEFPSYNFRDEIETSLDLQEFKKGVTKTTPAVAKDMTIPYLAGYYIGEAMIATDGIKMSVYDKEFLDTPILMPFEVVDKLEVLEGEEIILKYNGSSILFETKGASVYTSQLGGIDEFPDVESMVGHDLKENAIVKKEKLLELLDRAEIFTEELNDYAIVLKYKDNELVVKSLEDKSVENLPSMINGAKITQNFNVKYLREMIEVLDKEEININYSEELDFIKLQADKLIQLLATIQLEGE